jgi:feruloyl esterase
MRFLSAALVAASAVTVAHAWTADQCSNLINVLQLDPCVKILSTTPYPDNSTIVDPYNLAYPTPVPDLPAFCRVYANISTSPTSRTLFEVWLPLNTWNNRTMTVGNGGGNGAINLGQLGQGIRAGFATISTDGGHNSSSIDGAWEALGPEVATDFGWRSIHLSTLYGREILTQFYGSNYSYSYYVGCSSGGKQGYRELTLFPETFDGYPSLPYPFLIEDVSSVLLPLNGITSTRFRFTFKRINSHPPTKPRVTSPQN